MTDAAGWGCPFPSRASPPVSTRSDSLVRWRRLPVTDGELLWWPGFLSPARADRLFVELRDGLAWRQETLRLFGRSIPQPRLSTWYGDPGAHYRYSGLHLDPLPWHPALHALRTRLRRRLGHDFNSVLANRYRYGRDSMGWHSDDEPELGDEPLIASLSLGATRRFRLRHRARGETLDLDLDHGSLLIMAGTLQRHWQHQLPRTRRPLGERLNLTFRRILC